MGMYTEIVTNLDFREDLPAEVIDALNYMSGNTDQRPDNLPDHPLFQTDRWDYMLRCSSYYFVPRSYCDFFQGRIGGWFLSCRSDLKNYGSEIEKFFDWIAPYVDDPEGSFMGYSRYEESNEPKLYFVPATTPEGEK